MARSLRWCAGGAVLAVALASSGCEDWSSGEHVGAMLLAAVQAQRAPAPTRAPGLAFEVRPVVQREGSLESDVTARRMLALFVPRGEAATPFVAPGPFRATWRGSLDVPRRGDYVFAFEGIGKLSLQIDGETVLEAVGDGRSPIRGEAVRLKKGARELVASYQTPLSGAAELRVTWQSDAFAAEPIDPSALSHDQDRPELQLGRLRREGRMLIATRRCTACHLSDATGMPELAMRGPDLHDAASRLERDWLAAWLADPRALRPDARMPRTLHGSAEQRSTDVADLSAFVASLGVGGSALPAVDGDRQAGARHFAELGCFVCHDFDVGSGGGDERGATWVSLAGVGAKYVPGAIAAFVRDPGRHEPWTRMPDLKLSEVEARDLEAYLRARATATVPAAGPGDVAHGRQRFAELGCANCHAAGVEPVLRAMPLQELCAQGAFDRGCAAAEPEGAAVDFGFSAREREALAAFAAVGTAPLTRDARQEFAARQIDERRCDACHIVDGAASTWTARQELADAIMPAVHDALPAGESAAAAHSAVAQLRPALTPAGDKLRIAWMEGFFSGAIPSPRPWLHARMPRLPEPVAARLARGIAAQHGRGRDPEPTTPQAEHAAIGAELIEQVGGFGCVTCHAVGERSPIALFEVQGINLADVAARLRPDWYQHWMLDPPRHDAASKMPKYADGDGRTPMAAFDGDARQQFDAIWQHVLEIAR